MALVPRRGMLYVAMNSVFCQEESRGRWAQAVVCCTRLWGGDGAQVLTCVSSMAAACPGLFERRVLDLLVYPGDSHQIQAHKLSLLVALARDDTVDAVMRELEVHAPPAPFAHTLPHSCTQSSSLKCASSSHDCWLSQ